MRQSLSTSRDFSLSHQNLVSRFTLTPSYDCGMTLFFLCLEEIFSRGEDISVGSLGHSFFLSFARSPSFSDLLSILSFSSFFRRNCLYYQAYIRALFRFFAIAFSMNSVSFFKFSPWNEATNYQNSNDENLNFKWTLFIRRMSFLKRCFMCSLSIPLLFPCVIPNRSGHSKNPSNYLFDSYVTNEDGPQVMLSLLTVSVRRHVLNLYITEVETAKMLAMISFIFHIFWWENTDMMKLKKLV